MPFASNNRPSSTGNDVHFFVRIIGNFNFPSPFAISVMMFGVNESDTREQAISANRSIGSTINLYYFGSRLTSGSNYQLLFGKSSEVVAEEGTKRPLVLTHDFANSPGPNQGEQRIITNADFRGGSITGLGANSRTTIHSASLFSLFHHSDISGLTFSVSVNTSENVPGDSDFGEIPTNTIPTDFGPGG